MRNFPVYKKIKTLKKVFIFWRRHPDSNRGIRVLQTRALPLGYVAILYYMQANNKKWLKINGAENGAQTRDLCLGKASLYQLSYFRTSFINIKHYYNNKKWIKSQYFNKKSFIFLSKKYKTPTFGYLVYSFRY